MRLSVDGRRGTCSAPDAVLVILEMFCGVMYMALIVSRLIAMSAIMRGRPREG